MSDGVEHWHYMLASIGVVPNEFYWDTAHRPRWKPQFAEPTELRIGWREGAMTVSVSTTAPYSRNLRAVINDARLAQHPVPWFQTGAAPDVDTLWEATLVQFPGAGTWGLTRRRDGANVTAAATAIFSARPRELRIIQKRARQLIAGEGAPPKKIRAGHVRSVGLFAFVDPHEQSDNRIAWPPKGWTTTETA